MFCRQRSFGVLPDRRFSSAAMRWSLNWKLKHQDLWHEGQQTTYETQWSPAWNGWIGTCAASNSPLTSTPPWWKAMEFRKKQAGKTFQRTTWGPGRPPSPGWKLVARLVATERCEGPAYLRPSAPPINTFRTIWSTGCQGVLIMQNDPKHSALNEPVERCRRILWPSDWVIKMLDEIQGC